ncbi:MAG TPA: hypothetical protein VHV32_18985 [Candidatus Angelobacter sp.]|jgi:hypothetical protein|nr:hypothetical protein [Candidatus Angelobacter sp.]
MTRWKREYREWIKREKLAAWVTPKKWQDWQVAKAMSRLFDYEYRKPEVRAKMQEEFENLIIYGSSMGPSIFPLG